MVVSRKFLVKPSKRRMSAIDSFECPVEGCKVKVPPTTGEVQMMFLQTHNQSVHGALTTALPGDTSPGRSRGELKS